MSGAPVAAVDVLSVEKTYPDGTQALLPVDLRIAQGEFVTLLGPSGCGKSTLLKMVAGLLEPTDGRLYLWGKPVPQLHEAGKKMAFVFQAPTLMPWRTTRDNILLPLEVVEPHKRRFRANKAEYVERVEKLLASVGLGQVKTVNGEWIEEPAIVTLGNRLDGVRRLSRQGQTPYHAQDVVADILG